MAEISKEYEAAEQALIREARQKTPEAKKIDPPQAITLKRIVLGVYLALFLWSLTAAIVYYLLRALS